MPYVVGTVEVNGLARQSVPCYLFPASGFATPPVKNTSLPTTGMVTSGSTSDDSGQSGGYRFLVAPGEYYVGFDAFGAIVWNYHAVGLGTGDLALDDLTDVSISDLADGDFLQYYSGGAVWSNTPPYWPTTLNDLDDVSANSPTSGQTIAWYPGGWVAANPERALLLTLAAGFDPEATGADAVELNVPHSPADGTSALTFRVRRIYARTTDTGSGSGSVTVEKSTNGTGSFVATTVGTVTLGAGDYEGFATAGLGTVASGNPLRLNFGNLGGRSGFTVSVLLQAQ